MNFQKLLAKVDYQVLERTTQYLYVRINKHRFIFYNEQGLICFSLEKFNRIGITDFYSLFFAFSNKELLNTSNSIEEVNLTFEESNLSSVLGRSLKVVNLINVPLTKIKEDNAIDIINELNDLIITSKWKYSEENQLYYLIPNKESCIEFNSIQYSHFGNPIKLRNGTSNISYLNPYTAFEHLSIYTSAEEAIYLGPIKEGVIYIRSTQQELNESLHLITNSIKGTVNKINDKTQVLLPFSYSFISSNYQEKIVNALISEVKLFESLTDLTAKFINQLIIKPSISFSSKENQYTIVEFPNTILYLQTIIELLLNDLSKSLKIDNQSYVIYPMCDTQLPVTDEHSIMDENEAKYVKFF